MQLVVDFVGRDGADDRRFASSLFNSSGDGCAIELKIPCFAVKDEVYNAIRACVMGNGLHQKRLLLRGVSIKGTDVGDLECVSSSILGEDFSSRGVSHMQMCYYVLQGGDVLEFFNHSEVDIVKEGERLVAINSDTLDMSTGIFRNRVMRAIQVVEKRIPEYGLYWTGKRLELRDVNKNKVRVDDVVGDDAYMFFTFLNMVFARGVLYPFVFVNLAGWRLHYYEALVEFLELEFGEARLFLENVGTLPIRREFLTIAIDEKGNDM